MSATLLAEQRAAAESIFELLNAKEFDKAVELFSDSPDFRMHFAPASLHAFGIGKPEGMTKAEETENLKKSQMLFKDFGYQKPLTTIQETDKIFIHIKTDGKLVTDEPYKVESMLLITFEPGTAKILTVTEMLDSLWWSDTMKKMAALAEAGQA
ncbi:hypothetical protein MNV49_001440 [Pseudohyphozyma bogoriensis]|nr:hypothetical protein MNV49_001440 [Pseudohyphozyma bogoriensis]